MSGKWSRNQTKHMGPEKTEWAKLVELKRERVDPTTGSSQGVSGARWLGTNMTQTAGEKQQQDHEFAKEL